MLEGTRRRQLHLWGACDPGGGIREKNPVVSKFQNRHHGVGHRHAVSDFESPPGATAATHGVMWKVGCGRGLMGQRRQPDIAGMVTAVIQRVWEGPCRGEGGGRAAAGAAPLAIFAGWLRKLRLKPEKRAAHCRGRVCRPPRSAGAPGCPAGASQHGRAGAPLCRPAHSKHPGGCGRRIAPDAGSHYHSAS